MRAIIVFCVISLSLTASREQVSGESTARNIVDFSLYQIYPRSFKDSNGDGVGDLKGVASKLDHLVESNIDGFWLSPIYPSPMVDFGYDISNFREIDRVFGTMKDFDDLIEAAQQKSLKVIMDFVPNHSSNKHEWFLLSLMNIEPYKDYYVWHKGRVLANGTIVAPNNWVSVFGGPAWTWRKERQAYYLHQFTPEQPDLNYSNPDVIREMKDVLRFWLKKGVDGFRVDAIPHLCEDERYLDEPLTNATKDPNNYGYTEKIYTTHQPRTYDVVLGWRQVLDEFKQPKFMMMEAYANTSMTMKYYRYGAHFPFNFGLITNMHRKSTAADYKSFIDEWMLNMPANGIANWVAGNHDKPRLVTRLGPERARAATLITLLLPGVGVTYNGEEIGMEDTWISWEDTQDPQGCNAGKEGFETSSRDPARTPFQWDNTTSAGFSTNPKTWLRVNENYKTVNLEAEKKDKNSYYNFYKAMSVLKKSPDFKRANLITKLLNANVLAFSRETESHGSVYAVINFSDKKERVDLSSFDNISSQLYLYYATVGSDFLPGAIVQDIKNLEIPALGLAVFTTPDSKFLPK